MINKIILKLLHLPTTLVIRLSPICNRFIFKLKGIQFGQGMTIIGNAHIEGSGRISIGKNFMMTSGYGINPISSNLQGAIYADEGAEITIGDNVGMNSTRIRIRKSLSVGNHVKFGANVIIIDSDSHPIDYEARRTTNEGTKSAPIIIEDDVWIGAHSIILKGVTIGARSIIGAGSIVTRDVPADCVAAGNPCRVIKTLI